MGAPKGKSPNPAGKPKGTLNKTTVEAREAIARFVDGNAHRLETWLDAMAVDNPQGAFNAFMSVVEYHIPKLNRTTHEGNPDKPITQKIIFSWKE